MTTQTAVKQGGVEKVEVHRFRHTFATWAMENEARELDVQYLLGHSTPAMVRRYSATYDAEKAARVHERFSPADRMGERLGEGKAGPPMGGLLLSRQVVTTRFVHRHTISYTDRWLLMPLS
jgi:hypothetical protein